MDIEIFTKTRRLDYISQKALMPKEWLDSIVPENIKFFPSPYLEYPFMVFDDLLPKLTCKNLSKEVEMEGKKRHIGILSKDRGIIEERVEFNTRKTYSHIPSPTLEELYSKMFNDLKPKIEEFYKLAILQSSALQVLGYQRGYFYKRHSDNCSEILDKDGDIVGFTLSAPHRKLTTVFFISESCKHPKEFGEFSGGELVFDFIFSDKKEPLSLEPKRGMMVVFPSNPYFSHTVKKVLDGYRISLVQWHDCVIL